MKTFYYTILLAFLGLQLSFAQVGVGTTTPDPNAALDVESTTQGVLIPRMLKAQRELIGGGSPAAGLLVYQTDQTTGFYYYDGTSWVSLSSITPSGLQAINTAAPVGIPDLPVDGSGLVKVNRTAANYGDVGYEAVDLSFSYTADNTLGATGPGSLATGVETKASGGASTALGNRTVASGQESSTAMGSKTIASGDNATAMGFETTASGFSSTSIGRGTTAESFAQTTLGSYNVPTVANDAENLDASDRVLVVGNGADENNTSDALVILKNGSITAPSLDISEITDDKALVTKEYIDANANTTGVEAVSAAEPPGFPAGNGLVKAGRTSSNYGNVGYEAVDLSFSNTQSTTLGATGLGSMASGFETTASGGTSVAFGTETVASGDASTAMGSQTAASGIVSSAIGSQTIASGDVSTAMGSQTAASGTGSTAMGLQTTASGDASTAMGFETLASAPFSTAMGYTTIAEAPYSTAIGILNTGGGSPLTFLDTDPLFQIGNGTDLANRSDALTVLKNGTITAPSFDIAEITDDKALITKEYADANYTDTGVAPTGLETINEGNGDGLVKTGRIAANYGDIGESAVDLSQSNAASTVFGATGNVSFSAGFETEASGSFSFATGYDTEAFGSSSVAMGNATKALGDLSTALGSSTTASGDLSTAMGSETLASAPFSTAMGYTTIAEAPYSTAIGILNTGGGSPLTFLDTDPLFQIGNGTDLANRSDALTVLKNGTITAPSFDIAEITDDKALITKEYADANYTDTGVAPTGLETINEGNGDGLVKTGRIAANYGDIGESAVDLSQSNAASTVFGATGNVSFSAGFETEASGSFSFATGYDTEAFGSSSVAMGNATKALGDLSTALGSSTTASGDLSTAMGSETLASAPFSTAMGYTTIAEAPYSTAIGILNTGGGSPLTFLDTDPLFQIGNGTDLANRSDALTVLKNGTITAPSFDIAEITDDKALITKEYADANYTDTGVAPTGLETINEGNGDGLVKTGRIAANYGDIGESAVDLSQSNAASTVFGATGNVSFSAGFETEASGSFSFATGYDTEAFGSSSVAMGNATKALGDLSTALGSSTTASGDLSTAMGSETLASAPFSTAMGYTTIAEAPYSTAIGILNTGGGSPLTFLDTDPLFQIGNGTDLANRSDALTVLKNGTITAPSFDIAEITDDKALITKEYADANYTDTGVAPTGLETINEGNGDGLVKTGRIAANYGDIGESAVDLSQSNAASTVFGATGNVSFSAGFETEASGSFSFATGYDTEAFGSSSVAMGNATKALGDLSTALGSSTTASGDLSTAMGSETLASAPFSTAMGYTTIAEAPYSTAIGILNTGGGSPLTFLDTDPLFQIGNGTDLANRSDALTVLKNGTITAPSFDIAEITDDKALITKEYADANYTDAVFSGDYNDLTNLPTSFSDADNDTKIQVEESTDEDTIRFDLEGEERLVLQKSATGATSLAFPNNNSNTFLGEGAGILTTQTSNVDEGKYNVFIGNQAGNSNTTGAFNLFSGFYSGQQNTEGFANVFSGAFAGSSNTTGNNNIFLGIDTGITNTDGDFNVYLGNNAGASNSTGSRNIFLGYQSGYNETGSDKLYIDNSDTSTPLIYGEFDNDLLRINGILNVNNAFSFPSTDGTNGQVLLTDGSGTLSWTDPATFTSPAPTGLETIDEGNGDGLVRVSRDAANFGNIGLDAMDLSMSYAASTTRGATGDYSLATGRNTTASGEDATALGRATTASGDRSTAMGGNTSALGDDSTAMGESTTASGVNSTAMGLGSEAIGNNSTAIGLAAIAMAKNSLAIGSYNVANGTFNADLPNDPIFAVGNGIDNNNRSNALTVLKNGIVIAPSFSLSDIIDNKALVTKEYVDANALGSGLESIDEGNGNGFVKVGRDAANFGDIGLDAMDLSQSNAASITRGATGDYSLATGRNTTASGEDATALGRATTASGDRSTAMGGNTSALGDDSTAMGESTTASGVNSTAMGLGSEAIGNNSTAIGLGSIAMAKSSLVIGSYNLVNGTFNADLPNDPIFAVGNGSAVNARSNALTVLKNGTITAPSFDISEITDDKALITKEYADANYFDVGFSGDYNDLINQPTIVTPTGIEAVDEGNGIGFARVGRVSANYGNVGLGAVDLSDSGSPSSTKGATGAFSVAMGGGTTASGIVATAIGNNTIASGITSTAMGNFSAATGDNSTAIGDQAIASGLNSNAMGRVITAESYAQTTLGLYNVASAPSSTTGWIASDRLLVVGNGQSPLSKSDALVILKNGNATLSGNLTENSDFRLKKNIQPLENSLVKLLKLEGKNYYWNDLKPHSKDLQIGLIAQELETVFPELVHTGSDGYKSVDYTSLIPVLIEATKSQQEIIDTQNERIKALEEQNRVLLALEARLKALENDKNASHVANASK